MANNAQADTIRIKQGFDKPYVHPRAYTLRMNVNRRGDRAYFRVFIVNTDHGIQEITAEVISITGCPERIHASYGRCIYTHPTNEQHVLESLSALVFGDLAHLKHGRL